MIGAITESQKLINHALELEQRGGKINMCNALEELRQEGVEEGRQEGRLEGRQEGRQEGRWEGILEGIRATVRTCRNFNISETDTVRNIMNEFSLSQEEAVNYVKNTGKRKPLSVRAFGPSGPGLFTYIRVKYNTLFLGFRYLMDFHKNRRSSF